MDSLRKKDNVSMSCSGATAEAAQSRRGDAIGSLMRGCEWK